MEVLSMLGEVAHDVLALAPLAPLHGNLAEHLAHRRAESLRAVEHRQ